MPVPPIADFEIPGLGLTFRDYKRMPWEHHVEATVLGEALTNQLMSVDRAGTEIILCSDNVAAETATRIRLLEEAKASGEAMTNEEFDAKGLGVYNDLVPDPRFEDLCFIAYSTQSDALIGSFVILKIRHRPVSNGTMRSVGVPWPRVLDWRRMPLGVLWPEMMNFIMDNDLPFEGSRDALDIVEWRFPVSNPDASMFRHNDPDPHGVNGLGDAIKAGRDEQLEEGGTQIQYLRRSGERYDSEA